jgi:integrase
MRIKNIEVVMPRLVEGQRAWFVEYSCFNSKTNKLEKFRVYKGFRKLKTESEKIKYAKKVIDTLSKKLTCGWRPWDQSQYIYRDETQYKAVTVGFGNQKHNNSHIHKHLSDFLLETKRKVSAKTYESYQSKTRLFTQWLDKNGYEKCRIFELTNDVVKAFFNYLVDTRKLDRTTLEKYQQNLGQMFKFFIKRKLIDRIPMEDIVKPPKTKDNAARPMSETDMKTLLEYMAKNDKQMLLASLMQFFLCCRPGNELRLLKIQDLDFYNNLVHISQQDGKTGKRKITMPEALTEICMNFKLNEYQRDYYIFSRKGEPGSIALGKNFFSRKFAAYRKTLNLPSIYKFYSFKHTGAGKLLESGATIIEVMGHLGHTDVESTLAYVKRHFGNKSEKVLNFRPEVLSSFLK